MSVNQQKISVYFDRMTERFGVNGAGKLHHALLHGEITSEVRSKIRQVVTTPQVKQNVRH